MKEVLGDHIVGKHSFHIIIVSQVQGSKNSGVAYSHLVMVGINYSIYL